MSTHLSTRSPLRPLDVNGVELRPGDHVISTMDQRIYGYRAGVVLRISSTRPDVVDVMDHAPHLGPEREKPRFICHAHHWRLVHRP